MTTATMNRTTKHDRRADNRREKDQPNWGSRNRKMNELGLTSMDELRHYERIERGTAQQRQAPRKHDLIERDSAVYVGKEKVGFLEPLWDYIDSEVGMERDFPKDGTRGVIARQGKQDAHRFAEDDRLTLSLHSKTYPVTILSCYEASERLRYRFQFENGAEMALTQALLLRVVVETPADPRPSWLELLTAALSVQADYYAALLGLE